MSVFPLRCVASIKLFTGIVAGGSEAVCNYLLQADRRLTPASSTFFCEDLVIKYFYGHSSPSALNIQEEHLSVNGERKCTKYQLIASGRLAQEQYG